jgi:heme A synthase
MKMSLFRIQSLATTVTVYLLIVLGGVVSSTGSGLACPDWPLCYGQVVPELTAPVLIEFTHRLWAMIVTIFVMATMLLAWRKYRWPHTVTVFATLTFLLLVGQILLGMLTVSSGTQPVIVTAHLALAMLIFGSALTVSIASMTLVPRK